MSNRIHMQNLLRLAREESGVALVEFGVTAIVLMLLLFGVFEFGFGLYTYHFTSYAAQQGTRFAVVRGYTWSKNTTTNCSTSAPPNFTMPYDCTASATDIQNYVQSLASGGINPSSVTINTTSSYVWPGATADGTSTACTAQTNSQGCLVKVTVSYSLSLLPILKVGSLPITATSEDVILQ